MPPASPASSPAAGTTQPGGFTASDFVDYGQRYATLALEVPAGSEGVALLDTFARCEQDADLVELHRAGKVRLVAIDNMLAVSDSLRRRGWKSVDRLDAVEMDGRAHHGVAVTATRARLEDFADFAEQVISHHEYRGSTISRFVRCAAEVAGADPSPDPALTKEARRFLAAEWDRIRGVLPYAAEAAEATAAPPPPPPEVPGLPPAFATLLRRLCNELDDGARPRRRGPGAPRLPLGDRTFAVVMMVTLGATGRRAASELVAFYGAGMISRPVHFNTIHRAMLELDVQRALGVLAEKSARLLGETPEPVPAATDQTRARLSRSKKTAALATAVGRNLRHLTGLSLGGVTSTPVDPASSASVSTSA